MDKNDLKTFFFAKMFIMPFALQLPEQNFVLKKIKEEEQLFKGCHINDFSCLQIHDQVIEISRYGN